MLNLNMKTYENLFSYIIIYERVLSRKKAERVGFEPTVRY